MTWFERLFTSPAAAAYTMQDARTPIRSPWSSSSLSRIVTADLAGLKPGEITRSEAMKVPGIVRGRGLIAGTLSRYPLTLWQAPTGPDVEPIELPAPAFYHSTRGHMSPRTRMLWTLDDLIFSGLSLWALDREGGELDGPIVDAARVAPGEWDINPDGVVLLRGESVDARRVILFEGPQEGLCVIANEAIEASRNLAAAWQARVKSPIPLVELHQTDATIVLDDDEIDDAIDDWESARAAGGTAFTPPHITANIHGSVTADLFVEGRNAERLDLANYLMLPAALMEGSTATASLTYSTQEGRRSEFVDYSLSYWADPIEARLSQDDVSPDGTFTRFDLQYLTSTTQTGLNPGTED